MAGNSIYYHLMSKAFKHLLLISGISSGVIISWIFSHPSSPAKKKLPERSIKNIHFFPNFKIHRKKNHYHIHHWMYFGVMYWLLIAFRGKFKGKKAVEGFILGLVIHGLSYKDRFIVKKQARSNLFGFFRCGGGSRGFFKDINFLLNKSNRVFNIV